MKRFLTYCLVIAVALTSCEEDDPGNTDDGNDSPTNSEVIAGLKQALEVSTDTSVTVLNKINGYFGDQAVKILLPTEAQPVYDVLSSVPGMDFLIDDAVLSINRAAEDAAIEAKPIFLNAISNMTISDGFDILFGSDTAATSFLRRNTEGQLREAFRPKIEVSLSKDIVGNVSAEDAYGELISLYNTASVGGLLWDQITTNSLSEHTTNKALRGLFIKVAEQEIDIRQNPIERITDLLEQIFVLQDDEETGP